MSTTANYKEPSRFNVASNKDHEDHEDNGADSTEKFVAETTDLLGSILQNPTEETNNKGISHSQLSSEDLSDFEDAHTNQYSGHELQVGNKNIYSINLWTILRKSSINLILPFINGMMLGFGEILAHEIGFRYNWAGANVQPPRRIAQRNKRNQSTFL